MQMFIKKIMKIKRAKKMIYAIDLALNPDDNLSWSGECVLVRPTAHRLRCSPTLKINIQRGKSYFSRQMTFSAAGPKLKMTLYAHFTHIAQGNYLP